MPQVLSELLKELDMDADDVADGATIALSAGIDEHLDHRQSTAAARLETALQELSQAIAPALPGRGNQGRASAAAAAAAGVLPLDERLRVEGLVAKALTLLPGALGTNDEALHGLLVALNLTSATATTDATTDADADESAATGASLPAPLRRLLHDATATHCDGLRRQSAREEAVASLQKLLVGEATMEDPVPLPDEDSDGDGDGDGDGKCGDGDDGECSSSEDGGDRGRRASMAAGDSEQAAAKGPRPTWEADGARLVGLVYGGFEEQVRRGVPACTRPCAGQRASGAVDGSWPEPFARVVPPLPLTIYMHAWSRLCP